MDAATLASGLKPLAPEIVLLAAAAAAMFVHLFGGRRGPRAAGWVSLAGMAAAGAALAWAPLSGGEFYAGSLIVDPFAVFIKLAVLLAGALTVVLSFRFFGVERYEPGEIYILLPLAMIGMTVSASTVDLISTYVAFELFAITSYILAGLLEGPPLLRGRHQIFFSRDVELGADAAGHGPYLRPDRGDELRGHRPRIGHGRFAFCPDRDGSLLLRPVLQSGHGPFSYVGSRRL